MPQKCYPLPVPPASAFAPAADPDGAARKEAQLLLPGYDRRPGTPAAAATFVSLPADQAPGYSGGSPCVVRITGLPPHCTVRMTAAGQRLLVEHRVREQNKEDWIVPLPAVPPVAVVELTVCT